MDYFTVINETKLRLRHLNTAEFVQFVQQMKRVPQFSLMNTSLIAQYAPGANEVGTETALRARGIPVSQMETSVSIVKPGNGGRGFALHEVFAVTVDKDTQEASTELFNLIRSGCQMEVGTIHTRPHATNGERLWINPEQPILDTCLSLVTAWAHAELHFGENAEWAKANADVARFEAKIAAYVVLGAFGVETSDGAKEFKTLGLTGHDLYDSVTAIKGAVSTIWKSVQDSIRTGKAPKSAFAAQTPVAQPGKAA